ncbi:MAG: M48 family metallopeptidase [Desulfobacterales bacterium]|nr:M48 family metallopeptidase [Desulfobacterales bacterium]
MMTVKLISNDFRSKDQFKAEVMKWAEKISVNPGQIRVQKMTKKWASCSTNGCVCFSTDLLEEPRAFQDYVIVHELLHLQTPNHGKLFKSMLNAYLPDWKNAIPVGL